MTAVESNRSKFRHITESELQSRKRFISSTTQVQCSRCLRQPSQCHNMHTCGTVSLSRTHQHTLAHKHMAITFWSACGDTHTNQQAYGHTHRSFHVSLLVLHRKLTGSCVLWCPLSRTRLWRLLQTLRSWQAELSSSRTQGKMDQDNRQLLHRRKGAGAGAGVGASDNRFTRANDEFVADQQQRQAVCADTYLRPI